MKTKLNGLIVSLALMAGMSSLKAGVVFTNLVFFTYTNPPNYGANIYPQSGHTSALVLGDDGNFYGITGQGGLNIGVVNTAYDTQGSGTVFKMSAGGAFTSLYSFGSVIYPGPPYAVALDGALPVGNLTKGTDGKLYGVTYYGGYATSLDSFGYPEPTPDGTAFSITTNGMLANLCSFGNGSYYDTNFTMVANVNPTGANPAVGLVQGRDGNFYGTTANEGAFGQGTVFQLTPDGLLTTLHSFTQPIGNRNYDGSQPESELVEGNDGNFYGTTITAGASGGGTVFQITPGGTFTTLVSFDGTNGFQPQGGLVLGKDGNFYGTTTSYGSTANSTSGSGTVFQLATNGVLTTLHQFTGTDGEEPVGKLIQGSDGKLYGTTQGGGKFVTGYGNILGTIFQITTNGNFTKLYDFNGPDGQEPQGALVQGPDGSFYGTTSYGGPGYDPNYPYKGYGTIFRIIIPPVFQSIAPTNGSVLLTWSIMPGQTYQLQYTTDLTATNWLNLGSSLTASNTTCSATDNIGSDAQRFYRILLAQ